MVQFTKGNCGTRFKGVKNVIFCIWCPKVFNPLLTKSFIIEEGTCSVYDYGKRRNFSTVSSINSNV